MLKSFLLYSSCGNQINPQILHSLPLNDFLLLGLSFYLSFPNGGSHLSCIAMGIFWLASLFSYFLFKFIIPVVASHLFFSNSDKNCYPFLRSCLCSHCHQNSSFSWMVSTTIASWWTSCHFHVMHTSRIHSSSAFPLLLMPWSSCEERGRLAENLSLKAFVYINRVVCNTSRWINPFFWCLVSEWLNWDSDGDKCLPYHEHGYRQSLRDMQDPFGRCSHVLRKPMKG